MPRCIAQTKHQEQCKNQVIKGRTYCSVHRRQQFTFFGSLSTLVAASIVLIGFIANTTQIASFFGFDLEQEPFRIDYEVTGEGRGFVIQQRDPNVSLENYINNNEIVLSEPVIIVDVVGKAKEQVKIAPHLVIELVSVSPITETVDYFQNRQQGAGGSYRSFQAVLSPKQKTVFGAPVNWFDEKKGVIDVDFFTLSQGEKESFILHTLTYPGFYYTFKVGIMYSYDGRKDIQWINRQFSAGLPIFARQWQWSLTPNKSGEHYTYIGPGHAFIFDEYASFVDWEMEREATKMDMRIEFLLPK